MSLSVTQNRGNNLYFQSKKLTVGGFRVGMNAAISEDSKLAEEIFKMPIVKIVDIFESKQGTHSKHITVAGIYKEGGSLEEMTILKVTKPAKTLINEDLMRKITPDKKDAEHLFENFYNFIKVFK